MGACLCTDTLSQAATCTSDLLILVKLKTCLCSRVRNPAGRLGPAERVWLPALQLPGLLSSAGHRDRARQHAHTCSPCTAYSMGELHPLSPAASSPCLLLPPQVPVALLGKSNNICYFLKCHPEGPAWTQPLPGSQHRGKPQPWTVQLAEKVTHPEGQDQVLFTEHRAAQPCVQACRHEAGRMAPLPALSCRAQAWGHACLLSRKISDF